MIKHLAVLAIFVIAISTVSALSSNLKQDYSQQETMLVEFTGKITSTVSQDQVKLKRANVQVPFEFEFLKLGDDYFLWGIAPTNPNNYTLLIEDLDTIENGLPATVDFSQSFTVTNLSSPLTIKPAIITTSGLFQLNFISNIDLDQQIQVPLPDRDLVLEPGENIIPFDASTLPSGFNELVIANQPILIYKLGSQEEKGSIDLSITEISAPFTPSFDKQYELVITASRDIKVKLKSQDDRIKINQVSLDLGEGESKTILVNVATSSELSSSIILEYDGQETLIPVRITKNSASITPSKTGYYCSELEGKQCSSNEVCSAQVIETLDIAKCCPGTCQAQETSKSSSWLGWILGLILILLLGYLGLKYYKAKKA